MDKTESLKLYMQGLKARNHWAEMMLVCGKVPQDAVDQLAGPVHPVSHVRRRQVN